MVVSSTRTTKLVYTLLKENRFTHDCCLEVSSVISASKSCPSSCFLQHLSFSLSKTLQLNEERISQESVFSVVSALLTSSLLPTDPKTVSALTPSSVFSSMANVLATLVVKSPDLVHPLLLEHSETLLTSSSFVLGVIIASVVKACIIEDSIEHLQFMRQLYLSNTTDSIISSVLGVLSDTLSLPYDSLSLEFVSKSVLFLSSFLNFSEKDPQVPTVEFSNSAEAQLFASLLPKYFKFLFQSTPSISVLQTLISIIQGFISSLDFSKILNFKDSDVVSDICIGLINCLLVIPTSAGQEKSMDQLCSYFVSILTTNSLFFSTFQDFFSNLEHETIEKRVVSSCLLSRILGKILNLDNKCYIDLFATVCLSNLSKLLSAGNLDISEDFNNLVSLHILNNLPALFNHILTHEPHVIYHSIIETLTGTNSGPKEILNLLEKLNFLCHFLPFYDLMSPKFISAILKFSTNTNINILNLSAFVFGISNILVTKSFACLATLEDSKIETWSTEIFCEIFNFCREFGFTKEESSFSIPSLSFLHAVLDFQHINLPIFEHFDSCFIIDNVLNICDVYVSSSIFLPSTSLLQSYFQPFLTQESQSRGRLSLITSSNHFNQSNLPVSSSQLEKSSTFLEHDTNSVPTEESSLSRVSSVSSLFSMNSDDLMVGLDSEVVELLNFAKIPTL
ncbi:hypothetical protein GEMRC1_011665 [Eukaryota sp. GEM-RC1]